MRDHEDGSLFQSSPLSAEEVCKELRFQAKPGPFDWIEVRAIGWRIFGLKELSQLLARLRQQMKGISRRSISRKAS